MATGKILYFMDKRGISQGYEPLLDKILGTALLSRSHLVRTSVYQALPNPLKRYRNRKLPQFDVDQLDAIRDVWTRTVRAVNPSIIVTSCPATLGVLTDGDLGPATIDQMRGGVYHWQGIPVIVTYPPTVIHTNQDRRDQLGDDEPEQYKVSSGAWILRQDWGKIGRWYRGQMRPLPKFTYSVTRTLAEVRRAAEYLKSCVVVSSDIETGCWPPQMTCVGYYGIPLKGKPHAFVIPLYDQFKEDGCYWTEEDHIEVIRLIGEINDSPAIKAFQNGAYDNSYFIRDRVPTRNYLLDSQHLWHSIYPELRKSLDFVSSILCDHYQYWKDDIKGIEEDDVSKRDRNMEGYWRYNALDCYYTAWNSIMLWRLVQKNPKHCENYVDEMMRMFSGLAMSMRGVKANFLRREEHRINLTKERKKRIRRLRYLIADADFNPESSQQKLSLIYDCLGCKVRDAKGKPIRGNAKPSAGKNALKMARLDHPLFKIIIDALEDAMEPQKQISNVCDMKLSTDRFRTAYNAAGTETLRFSSKKSNFWDGGNAQNIRATYRDWLEADDGHVFLDADYSQSDDVIVGYEAQDPDKIEVIESGRDGHAVHGELFFGKPYDWIVDGKKRDDPAVVHPITGVRQLAKRIVHGTNFQMAAHTLYISMGGRDPVVAAAELAGFHDASAWPEKKLIQFCGALMNTYRRKYKRLTNRGWYKEILHELKTKGEITNAWGLTRKFMGNPNDNSTQREATAFYGQSGTASNMNRVMKEIDLGYIQKNFRDGVNPWANDRPRIMNRESHGFSFLMQIHDSFVSGLDTRNPNWKEAAYNLLYVMRRPVIIHGHTVKVRVDAAIGKRWEKKMIPWDGKDPYDLDRIILKL